MERTKNLLNAVGHVGVDFGYGTYELSKEEIEEARQLFNENPSESLNHIRAEVEEETIQRCAAEARLTAGDCMDAAYDIERMPRKYTKPAGPTVEE